MKPTYGGRVITLVTTLLFGLVISAAARTQDDAGLAKALTGVTVSLEQALRASAATGAPISAKFEIEDGTLKLSVYTMKAGKFSEVVVDHKTGKVAKAEPITGGDDLTAATSQSAALAKAKRPLVEAVARVVKANAGARAVSATAVLDAGQPTARVTLLQGQAFKTVSEKLD